MVRSSSCCITVLISLRYILAEPLSVEISYSIIITLSNNLVMGIPRYEFYILAGHSVEITNRTVSPVEL